MNAFTLERLFPTGWRRDGQILWRLEDATHEAEKLVSSGEVRGIRVLAIQVNPHAIVERFADRSDRKGVADAK
jgi:hypothetical protein